MTKGDRWSLYDVQPSFILGFHGCDSKVGEAILRGDEQHLIRSQNDYDWLGHGIYFWESNPARALEFAKERADGGKNSKGSISSPFVLGAVIDLGQCLNLLNSASLQLVRESYNLLSDMSALVDDSPLPTNGKDGRARKLDCAVIELLHNVRANQKHTQFDSVRGVFVEGSPLYPSAGFESQTHIQVCVRNPNSIKGYFRVFEL